MKISSRAKRDFEFFLQTELRMIGLVVSGELVKSKDGFSALECWYAQDTYGQLLPCREPELLDKVIQAKASWNLQIKLWAEDVADGMLLRQSELVDYCHGLPRWIFDATMQQAARICEKSMGWIPRFARYEKVFGQWWPPYMHDFDPSI